nr:receptor-like protein 12 [Ipomoea trifida]
MISDVYLKQHPRHRGAIGPLSRPGAEPKGHRGAIGPLSCPGAEPKGYCLGEIGPLSSPRAEPKGYCLGETLEFEPALCPLPHAKAQATAVAPSARATVAAPRAQATTSHSRSQPTTSAPNIAVAVVAHYIVSPHGPVLIVVRKWEGVSCSSTTGHVLKLDLHNLQATYDDDIGNYWSYSLYCNNCLEGPFKNLKYLNLSSSGFVGSIPTHLGNLSSLEYLDLGILLVEDYAPIRSDNLATNNLDWLFGLFSLKTLDMSGISIGHSESWLNAINKLVSLSSLNLAFCNLGTTNHLSHVNSTTSLVWLNLDWNQLDSTIFLWLSNLTRLEHLSLAENRINSGFPDMFEHLASLKTVDLGLFDNRFEGSIPNSLSHLCRLQVLDLSDNKLTDFTTVLSGCLLSSLKTLYLDGNNFSGQLPKRLFKYRNLESLSLSSNSFSGTIAESLGNLSTLQLLLIDGNKFSGSVPLNLGELSNLVKLLDISSNSFTGVLSEFHFSKLNKLDSLKISGNLFVWNVSFNWIPPFQLTSIEMDSIRMGPDFPHWLRTQRTVWLLSMSNASITNAILQWFWNFYWNCTVIDLSGNGISGNLPMKPHVGFESYMKTVEYLLLSNNQLKGEIPKWLCNLKDLGQLDLSTNKLSGEIPLCVGKLQDLCVLDLANNNLSGHIPISLGSTLYHLQSLHLRNNKLEGEVPSRYGDEIFKDIKGLKLHYNKTLRFLSGAVPESIVNLSNIESLDLSRNLLSIRIPPSLSSLNFLSYLNLSFNNLYGRTASGNQLQTLNDRSIYIGNEGLCGAPLLKSCSPSPKASSVDQSTGTSCDNHEFFMWFYAGLGPGFFVGFIEVLSILLFKRSWRFAFFKFLEIAYNNILHKIFIRD